ncbi:P1 family peptidase [Thermosporothrix hazakensis]|jgi:L-aminopeptidase/D-esterase-like protein|nr:P1 family peptidase [Thermosporothrix hazakensis]
MMQAKNPLHDNITDIPGIRVGHDTNLEAATGCTVILCDQAATGGVDIRGSAPATHETDLLNPIHLVSEVNAVLLTGGSAFGLAATAGVMRYLEEHQQGFQTGIARVPIVPAAAIFDLALGSANVRPDPESGYRACLQATVGPIPQGNVGAGTGASVGKMFGLARAHKGGLGSASTRLPSGILVGALAVVNAFGSVVDPDTREPIAGPRSADLPEGLSFQQAHPFSNTTLAVVATNVALTKAEATKLAQMAHDGLAQVIHPAHTMFDGDTIFALAVAQHRPDPSQKAQLVSLLGATASSTLARAILRAVQRAETLHGLPAATTS